ncbi:hypothetical protein BU16DRAFT_533201 [Lophium mytilinum]|uniref:Uncharacterized protein n=1 Tax=Lophium mytilinum TaxID=390894 RepID=A0A6A6REM4_9PEZI|nr:hypothetical protein BU16DRAFT_533201 [Lophium mytilinum]
MFASEASMLGHLVKSLIPCKKLQTMTLAGILVVLTPSSTTRALTNSRGVTWKRSRLSLSPLRFPTLVTAPGKYCAALRSSPSQDMECTMALDGCLPEALVVDEVCYTPPHSPVEFLCIDDEDFNA